VPEHRILLGVIGRPHGVRGLVRVTSHTADPAALAAYGPLSDDRGRCFVLHWRGAGLAEVEELVGGLAVKVTDRTAAEKLTNTRLFIDRAHLPEPEEEEFYLADLIGLTAMDVDGRMLGRVGAVHDYGAGASLEIVRDGAPPLLVPFTRAAVPEVDIAAGRVSVDLPHEVGEACPRALDPGVEARSDEGEGDRVGTLQSDRACRPDRPHPRRSRVSTSPAPAGEVAGAQRGRGSA
jgi:16S rRNA processing protein RimM